MTMTPKEKTKMYVMKTWSHKSVQTPKDKEEQDKEEKAQLMCNLLQVLSHVGVPPLCNMETRVKHKQRRE
jgi:hypothetical protein